MSNALTTPVLSSWIEMIVRQLTSGVEFASDVVVVYVLPFMVPVSLITGFFLIVFFIVRAFLLRRNLATTIKTLSDMKKKTARRIIELAEIEHTMTTQRLQHAWSEYTETLHPQREMDETGQGRIVQWRATSLAETFFSEHAIVGIPLKTEFYKHVPGILTGVGIIATFLGLIHGLLAFDVSDPAKVQDELRNLINAVGHAFRFSALAIAMAMFFTWIEKSMVTSCNRQLANLRELIDSLFDAGAGEEYLERLVRASETQATQALHIKDALVADLREVLKTMTELQIRAQSRQTVQVLQAQADHSARLSQDVGKAIAEHLGTPIANIAEAVQSVGANQGEAINKMLIDVLTGFSEQMQDMFAGQLQGMSSLIQETSVVMRQSAESFARIATEMDLAGKNTVDAMGERLQNVLTSVEAQQKIMNKQMGEFIVQTNEIMRQSQTESAQTLRETLNNVGVQVADIVSTLRHQAEEADYSQGKRQERFEESTGNVVKMISAQIERLLSHSVQSSQSLQESVASFSMATSEASARMNHGTEILSKAAADFAQAGQGVAKTMVAATEATAHIQHSSATISTAVASAREVLNDYTKISHSIASMVTEFKSITDSLRRDSAMTSEMIARIDSATNKLGEAQRQAETYLAGVTEILAKTHESFAEHVGKTLRDGNRDFQKELRTAVEMVSATVRDLSDILEEAPLRRS
ncbi:MAG: anti-phage defense ZorAB system ZorA [Magnetococcales bacterium]|nr:anti-phage defense ZorAB system ZorA [Magnetococcales bacterium]